MMILLCVQENVLGKDFHMNQMPERGTARPTFLS